MAEGNAKPQRGPNQKYLHSRISYLYQAATHLASAANDRESISAEVAMEKVVDVENVDDSQRAIAPAADNRIHVTPTDVNLDHPFLSVPIYSTLSRRLVAQLRAVSLKSQIRLSPAMKRSICKHCDILLVPGPTTINRLENRSRGGKKPWADVLVMTCKACGMEKRFPVGARHQPKNITRRRNMSKKVTGVP